MIKLSHIGEPLLAEMITRSAAVRERLNLHPDINAVPEVQLASCGCYGFDGAHKVDVALFSPNTTGCMAIEAKLGLDRLGGRTFASRFLEGCGLSHNNTRIKGNMISILERRFPSVCCDKEILLRHMGVEFKLSEKWILIIRQQVLDRWRRTGHPQLSEACTVVSFESLVSAYGGRSEFNNLVGSLVSMDYFSEWF